MLGKNNKNECHLIIQQLSYFKSFNTSLRPLVKNSLLPEFFMLNKIQNIYAIKTAF